MNKAQLLSHILDELKKVHQTAVDAAMRAYETATDEENVPEHKYDTLSLEASYLAQGQAQRVAECEEDLEKFTQLTPKNFDVDDHIAMGCLVKLIDEDDDEKYVFLGPAAGGLKITFNGMEITVVTPSAPLGHSLSGKMLDDEIDVTIGSEHKIYEIAAIY